MSTVWIMVMIAYGGYPATGAEFKSLEKCQAAAIAIDKAFDGYRRPLFSKRLGHFA